MTTIWRLNIKPKANIGVDAHEFCIRNSILGIGWQVQVSDPVPDWETYYSLGMKKYYDPGDKGWWPAINAIRNRMAVRDLCWTRDREGNYYIGKVTGSWKYFSGDDYCNADIVNVRDCKWFKTGTVDSVPGKILNSFRFQSTIQAVSGDASNFYSKLVYNSLSGEDEYDLSHDAKGDFFDLLQPEECEDIVGIYLQEKHGYRLIPSTCRRDTMKAEFVLRKVGRKALVQVKQGNQTLDTSDFNDDPNDPLRWFLFATSGEYVGGDRDHVSCLDPEEMRTFAMKNRALMPRRIQTIIDFFKSGRSSSLDATQALRDNHVLGHTVKSLLDSGEGGGDATFTGN